MGLNTLLYVKQVLSTKGLGNVIITRCIGTILRGQRTHQINLSQVLVYVCVVCNIRVAFTRGASSFGVTAVRSFRTGVRIGCREGGLALGANTIFCRLLKIIRSRVDGVFNYAMA